MDKKYITIKIRRDIVDELRDKKRESGVPIQYAIEKAVKNYLAEIRGIERR